MDFDYDSTIEYFYGPEFVNPGCFFPDAMPNTEENYGTFVFRSGNNAVCLKTKGMANLLLALHPRNVDFGRNHVVALDSFPRPQDPWTPEQMVALLGFVDRAEFVDLQSVKAVWDLQPAKRLFLGRFLQHLKQMEMFAQSVYGMIQSCASTESASKVVERISIQVEQESPVSPMKRLALERIKRVFEKVNYLEFTLGVFIRLVTYLPLAEKVYRAWKSMSEENPGSNGNSNNNVQRRRHNVLQRSFSQWNRTVLQKNSRIKCCE